MSEFGRQSVRMRLSQGEAGAVIQARELGRPLEPLSDEDISQSNIKDETRDGGMSRELAIVSEIRTVEDALRLAEVDESLWSVDRSIVNKWDMGYKDGKGVARSHGLWQVKIWLKRRAIPQLTEALDSIHERAKEFSPAYDDYVWSEPEGRHLFVPSLYDSHFGKLAWREETLNDHDLPIAEAYFDNAMEDLFKYAEPFDIGHILFPFGNDFLHIDNTMYTTQKGTPLGGDTDGRYAKIVETAFMALVRAIDRASIIAPVTVLIVQGNHDPTVMYHMGRELKAWYRHSDRVKIQNRFIGRKYFRYGNTLLGFNHGDDAPDARLCSNMPLEAKEDWALSKYYEIHTGHLHIKREKRPWAVNTVDGILVRRVPSLSGTDAWHFNKGYVGYRAAEAYIYHEENGPVGSLTAMGRAT